MTGESIQIVEDDGLIAFQLTELLEKAGYHVPEPAYSGEIALRTLETSQKPDLIIIDIGLAGSLDGIETARQIKQRSSIALIFITAYFSDDIFLRIQEEEIDPAEIIIKPFLDSDLLDKVGKALSR
jgi:CheY-like chemotaxis protein